jgi:hypothetical protein
MRPIVFPHWVKVTECETRSMTIVLPNNRRGAMKWVRTHPVNRPGYYGDHTVRVY